MAITLVVVGIIVMNVNGNTNTGGTDSTGGSTGGASATFTDDGSVQEFTIGLSGGYYTPKEIRVSLGTNVRLYGDANTLKGCMTKVIVEYYGSFTAGGEPLEFVADKPGVFQLSCPMGMGSGQLIVEDASGEVPEGSAAAAKPVGGCGCGG